MQAQISRSKEKIEKLNVKIAALDKKQSILDGKEEHKKRFSLWELMTGETQ